MAERHREGENKSILDSRLFKGGAVATALGAVFGIGIAVELGLLAAGGGAAAHYATKKKEK